MKILVPWALVMVAVACSSTTEGSGGTPAEILARALRAGSIEPADLVALIDAGIAPPIVDVRSNGEWKQGRVPGAQNIPFNQVSERIEDVKREAQDPVVVYCGHGPRAWMARWSFKRKAVKPVILLNGHWTRWSEQGLPVEK